MENPGSCTAPAPNQTHKQDSWVALVMVGRKQAPLFPGAPVVTEAPVVTAQS